MANLVVLAFEGSGTAASILGNLEKLQDEGALEIEDAVVASRPARASGFVPGQTSSDEVHISSMAMFTEGSGATVERSKSVKKHYGWRGAGVGVVAGLLLGGPIGGLVAGAAVGGIAGHMKNYGIDDDFAKQVAGALPEESSAIFLLGTANDRDRVLEELSPFKPKLLSTSLDPEEEKRLRDELAGKE